MTKKNWDDKRKIGMTKKSRMTRRSADDGKIFYHAELEPDKKLLYYSQLARETMGMNRVGNINGAATPGALIDIVYKSAEVSISEFLQAS